MSSSSSSSRTPQCAACNILDRVCNEQCVFAPYFPPDQPHRFDVVYRVHGPNNVANFINRIPAEMREDAVNSLVSQAEAKIKQAESGKRAMGPSTPSQGQGLFSNLELLSNLATDMSFQEPGTSNSQQVEPVNEQELIRKVVLGQQQQPKQLPAEFWPWFEQYLPHLMKDLLTFNGRLGDVEPSAQENPVEALTQLMQQFVRYEVHRSLTKQEVLSFMKQQKPAQQALIRAMQDLIQKEIIHQLLDLPSDPPPPDYVPFMPEFVQQEIARKRQNQRSQQPQQEQHDVPQPPQWKDYL